ncbi:MAG: diacylglycerol kinase family lipid kinase [Clostridiales bacterium]|nr:diacylglycerol kinase family lipid kinase [Clostridiales bacterium]
MDREKQILFIYNRHSGKKQTANRLADLMDLFCQEGYLLTSYSTQCRGDATRIAAEEGVHYPLVICSGGDGTLSEVVNGLLRIPEEQRPSIGYIPSGSTNDFAATLSLPTDLLECARIILRRNARKLDVGMFCNKRAFVYVAAFGAFTETSYATPQAEKNLLGYHAYVLHGLKELVNLRSYPMQVTMDGKTVEGDFLYGMVYNANSVGGFRNLSAQPARLDDGQLDILLVKAPETTADWPAWVSALMGKKSDPKYFISAKAKDISFSCDEPVDWVLDGEYGGSCKNVQIDTLHREINVLVAKKE